MADEDLRAAERLIAVWEAGVALSLPLGDGVFERGLHAALPRLPAPIARDLGFEQVESGEFRSMRLAAIVAAAVERGILKTAYAEPYLIGIPMLPCGRSEAVLDELRLSPEDAYEAARSIFEACCRRGRRSLVAVAPADDEPVGLAV